MAEYTGGQNSDAENKQRPIGTFHGTGNWNKRPLYVNPAGTMAAFTIAMNGRTRNSQGVVETPPARFMDVRVFDANIISTLRSINFDDVSYFEVKGNLYLGLQYARSDGGVGIGSDILIADEVIPHTKAEVAARREARAAGQPYAAPASTQHAAAPATAPAVNDTPEDDGDASVWDGDDSPRQTVSRRKPVRKPAADDDVTYAESPF